MRFLSSLLALAVGALLCVSAHADTFTVTSTADTDGSTCGTTCTLRQAMNAAKSTPSVAATINFDSSVFGASRQTIQLGSRLPSILSTFTINGPAVGVTLDAQKKSSIFGIFTNPTKGSLTLSNCALINGHVSDTGGAIYNGNVLNLSNCTLSNNDAYRGGAIDNYGTATLSNCTLSGNKATDDIVKHGGAIFNIRTLTLSNCTIVGNTTQGDGGGIYNDTGTGNLTMNNCIVAGNSAPKGNGPDIRNRVDSGDYNLVQNAAGASLSGTHNITGQDPQLSSLADNGGPTQTFALQTGSPAIDAGNSSLTTDQRGLGRPFDFPSVANASGGTGSDIGAFELNETPQNGSDFVVNQTDDHDDGVCGPTDCTLREAINAANTDGKDSTITFAASVFGSSKQTITLKRGTLPGINSNLTLTGPSTTGAGVTLDSAKANQDTIDVNGGTVFINNLTFTGAYIAVAPGGGTTTVSGCTFTGNNFGIGTEPVLSTVHVNNSTFFNNGDAVLNEAGYATITVDSCTITGNSDGVYTDTGNNGTTTVSNSIVVGNSHDFQNSINGGNNTIGGTAAEAGLQTTDGQNAVVLTDNGGPTATIALVNGSKAINAGATSLKTDQRGFARPIGKAPDRGAFEVQNTAPTVNKVTITPDDPTTNQTLTANVDASDAETPSNQLTYKYQWLKTTLGQNGGVTTVTTLPETGPTLDLSKPDNGNKGEQITVIVTANDGQLDSQPKPSAPVTIGNSAPVVDNVVISPSNPTTNATLSFTIGTETDDDGDTLKPSYQWYKNDQLLDGETGDTLDLSKPNNGDVDDVLTVQVTVSDGTTSTKSTSPGVKVVNSAPTLSSVSISPSDPTTNQTLTAVLGDQNDPDGGTSQATYQWYKNEQPLAGETNQTLDLSKDGNGDKGDSITVTATLSDGTTSGNTATSKPVKVANSAPEIAPVSIVPASPKTDSLLSVQGGVATDADGESLTVTYQWQKNGVDLPGQNGATLDLKVAGVGDKDDRISVVVTAKDDTVAVSRPSESVTIVNSAPVVDDLTLGPDAPKVGATLTATVSASDADSDALTYTYTWTRVRDGRRLVLQTTKDTKATSDTLKTKRSQVRFGDTVIATVVASDGTSSSAPVEKSLALSNTPVNVTSIIFRASRPTTDTLLYADVMALDDDDVRATITYQWSVTHNGVTSVVQTTTSTSSRTSLDLSQVGKGNKGDTLTLLVTATDGQSTSSKSATIQVFNSLPQVTGAILSPSSPTRTSTVTARITTKDPDVTDGLDTLTPFYKWYNGTRFLTSTSTNSLDLSKYPLKSGDTLVLSVRVSDGTAFSHSINASVKIASTPPKGASPATPLPPSAGSS